MQISSEIGKWTKFWWKKTKTTSQALQNLVWLKFGKWLPVSTMNNFFLGGNTSELPAFFERESYRTKVWLVILFRLRKFFSGFSRLTSSFWTPTLNDGGLLQSVVSKGVASCTSLSAIYCMVSVGLSPHVAVTIFRDPNLELHLPHGWNIKVVVSTWPPTRLGKQKKVTAGSSPCNTRVVEK